MEVFTMIHHEQHNAAHAREQAIRDGLLVDATDLAHALGFRYGVALTKTAWERCVSVPDGPVSQDEVGRLHDVLYMLAAAIRRNDRGPELGFAVYLRSGTRGGTPPVVQLRSRCEPGDDGEPCLTIMLPGEH